MLLSLQKITKRFPVSRGLLGAPTAYLRALNGVSLELDEGQVVGIVGESGCGKSTLGRCAVGLLEPTEGEVYWDGGDVKSMDAGTKRAARRFYQVVFQNPFASLDPRQRVGEILSEPFEVHGIVPARERAESVRSALEKVGLSAGDLGKYPHEFSGGQRQRIALARALVCGPKMIVLDEPLSSLDVSVQASILNLLAGLNREQRIAYLFISHDLRVVGFLSQKVMVMYLGEVVEAGSTAEVMEVPRHPYTRALLEASSGQSTRIEGEPPDPVHPPPGCLFAPRCPFAENRCREERQTLAVSSDGRSVACWKWDKI